MQAYSAMIANFSGNMNQNYFVDATSYKLELIRRLGPQIPPVQLRAGTFWDFSGHPMISEREATGSADYLDYLADQLPSSKEHKTR